MKYFIHTCFLLLLGYASAAQQFYVKGVVRDETGKPLPNATILLSSTGYKYSSGSEGSFGILVNTLPDTLTIVADGYVRQVKPVNTQAFVEVRLRREAASTRSTVNHLASQTQNLKRDVQQKWFAGEETYASLVENNFVDAAEYPLTHLSLNVDRASYSNVRRFLKTGSRVPPDAVRIDEMLNYFNFNYTAPPEGETFSLHSILTDCPWNKKNKLLLVQVNAKKLRFESLPPTHLVFLVDVSGSMDMPNRLPLLKDGFKLLVQNLREIDSVSIAVYGGTVGVALTTTGGNEKEKIYKVIDSLQPGGFTPGASGIRLAYQLARDHFIENGNNRVVLATDGDFNVGLQTEEELERMIATEEKKGIYLTCLGIGMGNYKDSKIQMLAQRGHGNFAYLDNFAEAEKVLMREFAASLYVVADDALLQVTFDPQQVQNYRLIGFDNKYKAVIDSASVVQGGEIGSGYSNLIAFELQGQQQLTEADILFSIRYKTPGGGDAPTFNDAKSVPYMKFEQLPAPYRLAGAVMMFGGVLKDSRFIKGKWKDIARIAAGAADADNLPQQEFLSLIELAKEVYSKKRK